TPLPIQLEELSELERKIMIERQEADTSSYLIDSRPIVFQIQGVKNNSEHHRNTQPIHKDIDVFIYAFGEVKDGAFVDYGWIEDVRSNRIVWKMDIDRSKYAGGDARNRKTEAHITLPKGHYRLHYKSNESHANEDWTGDPPERPFYYGITVFNLSAIEKLNQEVAIAKSKNQN
ncbi:MAG: hypothetical protein KJO29_03310, partial [Bacteroidia bacterium]|nr:hypothetical protein [Bacteroidia bacterium]